MENHLIECNKFINLQDEEAGKITKHFKQIYKFVTDSMAQKDNVFKDIFQREQLAGSYADNIKVGQPDEYDALVVLKFSDPVVEKSLKAGFVKINITNGLKKFAHYKPFVDGNGYLLQDKVLAWIRAMIYDVIKTCKNIIKIERNEYEVEKATSNGPAITLDIKIIRSENGATGKFSIDFVSALAFDFKEQFFADFKPQFLVSKYWNAIAKPNKDKQLNNPDWICSYADLEREYLKDTQNMKQLIRLFKKIRDKENLANFKSYYIKLIFLHQRRNKEKQNNYWKQSLSVLFLEMFDIILDHLKRCELVSFWHKKYNLFSGLNQKQIEDIYNKLKKIRDKIHTNMDNGKPEFIRSVILTPTELESLPPKVAVSRANNSHENTICKPTFLLPLNKTTTKEQFVLKIHKQRSKMSDFDSKYQIIDSVTPINVALSGRYKKSFGYYTIRERLPVILTQIQDYLSKEKDTIANGNEQTKNDIKTIQAKLSKLKYELQTDKVMDKFDGVDTDRLQWNEFLSTLNDDNNSYFKTTWLFAECYMYRKLKSFFEDSQTLKDFDYFRHQKTKALTSSFSSMSLVIKHVDDFQSKEIKTQEQLEEFFTRLLKLNLWGNRCDLSISAGREVKQIGNPFLQIDSLNSFVLVDRCKDIWNCVSAGRNNKTIDFILDNAGYELFTDLVLARFLLDNQFTTKIRFHIKAIPWFISDVNVFDFNWTIKTMSEYEDVHLSSFGGKLQEYSNCGKIELLKDEYFWTGPYEFYRMKEIDANLYDALSTADLLIFKGDLNYRKLLGDFNWPFDSTFETVLRGFRPTNLCALRTVKADIVCEVDISLTNELSKNDPMWMETGQYGVINFISKAT
ncbi:Damage-control phosphatase ARMT1 [Pseudolycoriella hygida]|uniref:Damage-control phosphatase ARMT1 n=1 Tax=Pseudolycoriella hygida TaxID=35572 RepID=A0A9Q0RYH1_9DIPT|nr:Damage-control phosphatase ARMT1 [Pseudolycoriella hygida]